MFLQCLGDSSDLDECFALLSDDFTYWNSVNATAVDTAQLRRGIRQRGRPGPVRFELIRCLNDGEAVVVEAQGHGTTADGRRFDSPYVFIFETHDGLITGLREYSDARLAAQLFDTL
ncbi:nuclear transport factor 2 family protein [Mycobacterium sp.]|uniref:nuclear transport factor 2 family protein n=1 Tax=Mycobacterium sp. TaxID=1785 RepID=UPI00126C6089|nr:nuclear transport factor 2 family protein [Mycobacterium sp.]KAA8968974.1 MAG: nuclear transport factor 2 family protein [Mycobacterium sp.]